MADYYNNFTSARFNTYNYESISSTVKGWTGYSNTFFGASGNSHAAGGLNGLFACTGGTIDYLNLVNTVVNPAGSLALEPFGTTCPNQLATTNMKVLIDTHGSTTNCVLISNGTSVGSIVTWPRIRTYRHSNIYGHEVFGESYYDDGVSGATGLHGLGDASNKTRTTLCFGPSIGASSVPTAAADTGMNKLWGFVKDFTGLVFYGNTFAHGGEPSATGCYDILLAPLKTNITLIGGALTNASLNSHGDYSYNAPKCATGHGYPHYLIDKTCFVVDKYRNIRPIAITRLDEYTVGNTAGACNYQWPEPAEGEYLDLRPTTGTTAWFAGFTNGSENLNDFSEGVIYSGPIGVTSSFANGGDSVNVEHILNGFFGETSGTEGCPVFLTFRNEKNELDYAMIGVMGTGLTSSPALASLHNPSDRINLFYDDLAYRINYKLETGIGADNTTGPTMEFVDVCGFNIHEKFNDSTIFATGGTIGADLDLTKQSLVGEIDMHPDGVRRYKDIYFGLTSEDNSDRLTNKFLYKIKINADSYWGMITEDVAGSTDGVNIWGTGGGMGGSAGMDNTEKFTMVFSRPIEWFKASCYTQSYESGDFAVYDYGGNTLGQSALSFETFRFAGTGPTDGCTLPSCYASSTAGATYADAFVGFTAEYPGVTAIYIKKTRRGGSAWALRNMSFRPVQGSTFAGTSWGYAGLTAFPS